MSAMMQLICTMYVLYVLGVSEAGLELQWTWV